MNRITLAVLTLVAVTACRDYDGYAPVADQTGLIPAAQWASYGVEQAQAVAIGREFAAAYQSDAPEALGHQMNSAVEYARSLGVEIIVADTLGHRLTVRFPSGWRLAILPIDDGVAAADTPGIRQ
jgi:hypothetical protein